MVMQWTTGDNISSLTRSWTSVLRYLAILRCHSWAIWLEAFPRNLSTCWVASTTSLVYSNPFCTSRMCVSSPMQSVMKVWSFSSPLSWSFADFVSWAWTVLSILGHLVKSACGTRTTSTIAATGSWEHSWKSSFQRGSRWSPRLVLAPRRLPPARSELCCSQRSIPQSWLPLFHICYSAPKHELPKMGNCVFS